jgi:hypothetical protein
VTVTKSPIAGESTKETVKTIRVRECRVIPVVLAVTTLVRFLFSPREAAGADRHPAFPTPSVSGRMLWAYPGRDSRRGMRRRAHLVV